MKKTFEQIVVADIYQKKLLFIIFIKKIAVEDVYQKLP